MLANVKTYGINGAFWESVQDVPDVQETTPDPTPSELDRLEAQVVYTAMMTDTLLEEG